MAKKANPVFILILIMAIFSHPKPANSQQKCVQLPVACTSNSDCTCSGCCGTLSEGSSSGICQPSCQQKPEKMEVRMQISQKLLFTALAGFIFLFLGTKISTAALQTCIAPGYPCTLDGTPCCSPASCQGTSPNMTCQLAGAPVPNPPPDCIPSGQACVLNGKLCCNPATCQGTFPNTTCQ